MAAATSRLFVKLWWPLAVMMAVGCAQLVLGPERRLVGVGGGSGGSGDMAGAGSCPDDRCCERWQRRGERE